jgi:succinyl-diaminopimelate desuccinylase
MAQARSSADPVAIARDLVRCRSVTPTEGGALGVIEGLLEGAGFAVHRMTFAEAGSAPVENLAASRIRGPHRRRAAR